MNILTGKEGNMDIRTKLHQEYEKWDVKLKECRGAQDKLASKAKEVNVTLGKANEPWAITPENQKEIDRLEVLCQEAENKKRDIVEKIERLQ
jgi:hypothetical protein